MRTFRLAMSQMNPTVGNLVGNTQKILTSIDEARSLGADLVAFPEIAEREFHEHLPFLATTRVLVAAVQAGLGRETAHSIIGEHAAVVAQARRSTKTDLPDLFDLLASDDRLPLDREALGALLVDQQAMVGNAPAQVQAITERVAEVVAERPEAAAYNPEPIL